MNNLNNYDDFINESLFNKMGIPKFIDKLLNIFTNKNISKKDLYNKLSNILIKYKEDIINKEDIIIDKENIIDIIKKLNKELGEDIVFDFNLDSFFRGLYNILKVVKDNKKEKIEKYFDSYLENLEERVNTYFNTGYKDFSEDDEFEELRKIKKDVLIKIPKKQFKKEKVPLQIELLKMQEWMKRNGHKLAIVFEGRDAAGKGSAIKTITEYLQPKYFNVETFGIPTEEERKNWFYRYEKVMPKPGNITFFDRSWYNRAVNDPVMGYCTDEEYNNFIENVVPFEERMNKKGIQIIKFWFSVTKETQELRFKMRQVNPLKYWKFSPNDLKSMSKWEQFTYYKERMFSETSTPENPWVVVDSDDKRLAQLNAIKYILNEINYIGKDKEIIGEPLSEIIIPML